MNPPQLRIKQPNHHKRGSSFSVPCEISLSEEEIHRYPQNVRRSVKMQQHRLRPTLNRRSRPHPDTNHMIQNVQAQLNANINIGMIANNRMLVVDDFRNTPQPPIKLMEEFQTTADRMLSMRKKLSPVKRFREDKRAASSMDRMREPVQRATFLNIEKVELIKMYSERERSDGPSRSSETAESRQMQSPLNFNKTIRGNQSTPPPINFTQAQRDLQEVELSDMVVELRKTLKESNPRWHTSRPRIKPFMAPFERYNYRDFIWKVAFSNGLMLTPLLEEAKVKVFVGRGNNSQLVRSLLKRRGWWSFTQKWEEANLVWTQIKINGYFALQSQGSKFKAERETLAKEKAVRNQLNLTIMNENDVQVWDTYWKQCRSNEFKMGEDMSKRNNYFRKQNLPQLNTKTVRIQNHMSQNFIIGNKKALLYTMRQYYENCGLNVFDYLPLSFHLSKGVDDPEYARFLGHFYQRRKKSKKDGTHNVWIVKPGELTCRGNGIIVCLTLQQIKSILKKGGRHFDGTPKTFIVQQYIQKPFLYQKRKFDIRHFILVTSVNGRFKGYWFKRGYLRTSSFQYTLMHGQANVHLTNDAVQKYLPDYGKFQKGNKVSYQDFQIYLAKEYHGRFNFNNDIYPKMKKMAMDVVRASARALDPCNREHNFELFGLDFMIDQQFQPWLIQCNSNPSLEMSCPLQNGMVPALIENTLRIAVDSLVGPPADFQEKRPRFADNALASNEFELVYDSVLEEGDLQGAGTLVGRLNLAQLDREEEEVFEDDGEALED